MVNRRSFLASSDCQAWLTRTAISRWTRTRSRDLVRLADLGLLTAKGERRGRYYVAGGELAHVRATLRAERAPVVDAYPTLTEEIRRVR